MIQIHRMTATFGRLENETLEITPGLNVFTAPNEAGKSTWAAFIMAMFYGIDTAERAKKGTLPAKTKYKPWSGKPMEGVMELTADGRRITIQRQSDARTPMGKFTAYDTVSGETLDYLTAENCGKTLLGVEQSVFARSAFIGQNAMSVTQDPGLEQKLSGLVTAGDETVSYTQTERRLRDWKNHVRHNKTGYLPETETALEIVTDKLSAIRQYHKEDLSLSVRRQELTAEKEKWQYIEKNLKAAEALAKQTQLHGAEQNLQKAQTELETARQAAEKLPSLEELDRQVKQWAELALREELTAKTATPQPPAQPQTPDVFQNLSPEQAKEKAETDAGEIRLLQTAATHFPLWIIGVVLLAVSAALTVVLPILSVTSVLGLGVLLVSLLQHNKRKKQAAGNAEKAAALLSAYGAKAPEELSYLAAAYGESRRQYAEAQASYERQSAAHTAEKAALEQLQQKLLTDARSFASNIYTADDAKAALSAAVTAHRLVETAQSNCDAAGRSLEAVRAAVGDVTEVTVPAEDFTGLYTLAKVSRKRNETEQELHTVETAMAQHRGLVQSLGDVAALEAEKQQLESRRQTLLTRENALALAMDTLRDANCDMSRRFSPKISQAAGEILARMTGGRYDTVRMEQDLTLHARPSGEAVTRELLTLSSGMADQLYLALRLAVCDLALDEGTPLVLDDALVFFDDDRLAQTMELLKEEALKRQILLFTCQNREANYIKKNHGH